MKRGAIIVLVILALVAVGWFLWARLTTNVETIVETRKQPAPRAVAESWPSDRFSPGHSEHVLNRRLACNDCHDPAKPDFSGVDMGVCTSCHEEQAAIAHMGSDLAPTTCFDCHTFKFDELPSGPWDCVRCHGPFDAETHQGLAMHNTMPCASCHDPHKPVAETLGDCTSCHEDISLRHGHPESSGTCIDCHGGHKLATDAASCMQCHGEDPPHVSLSATFGGGHDSCASCHRAHDFSKRGAVSCTTCHEGTVVLASNEVRAHNACTNCHSPHAVRGADDATCSGCHSDIDATHPRTDGKTCTSCHEPHPKRVAKLALRCADCHEEASSDRSFHATRTACIDCHEPHGFDLTGLSETQLCVRCHAQQVRLTSHNAGHANCSSCHTGDAHQMGGPVACESCHAEVLSTGPEGHNACASCHEPHRGSVAPTTRCTTCHNLADLPGLHRIPTDPSNPGHTECTACHDVHIARARADRATCMTCHKDIANHEPDAKRCTGCHTFIKGH
ncbi:MAG: cytochrome c3 family protein [Polyangiales bacterium]